MDDDLAEFMNITGCSDPATAENYLTFGGGDIQQAIMLYLESGGNASLERGTQHNPIEVDDDVQFVSSTSVSRNQVREVIPASRQILNPIDPFEHPTFARHARSYSSTPEPFQQGMHDTGDVGADTGIHTLISGPSPWEDNDRLAKLFQPPVDLIYKGSFEMACQEALKSDKSLIVTIHDSSEFVCQALNRDLWKNQNVKELIKEKFIFLQLGSNSPAGLQHRNFYPFDNYPYIALLDPLTLHDYLESIQKPKPKDKPTEKDVVMLSEEEQLELAIAASMGQEPKLESSQPKKVKIESSDPVSIFNNIIPNQQPETVRPANETTRIQLRFPNGQKSVRKFNKDDKVEEIFAFIKGNFTDVAEKPFDLKLVRDSLLLKLDQTIEQVGALNSSLALDYI